MAGATARQRASIAISFGIQAALIAALLSVPALTSTHPGPAVRAAPQSATTAAPSHPAAVYPMRLWLLVNVDGGRHVIDVPGGWAAPPQPVSVPAGRAATVAISVATPGPGTATSVWFAIAAASTPASAYSAYAHAYASAGGDQLTQLEISLGSRFRLEAWAGPVAPGGA